MAKTLIDDIDTFLTETGLSAYRFGYLAVKNGRLVERLRSGRRVWPETEAEVRAFMLAEQKRRRSNTKIVTDTKKRPAPEDAA